MERSGWRPVTKRAMLDRNMWKLVERPPQSTNIVRGLWLFRKKVLLDGVSVKFKARFVVMGNTQEYREDYGEMFAPTGKPSSLRLLTAIAAINSSLLAHSSNGRSSGLTQQKNQ